MTSDSLLTAAVVLDALEEAGLRELFVCPGSRSAPFAYQAAARDGVSLRAHVRLDERSAAFHALGAAKATGRPAAVVTTSGTAAGELMPAVMEAHHAGVALVVITADRPPELRGTGANQTTIQPGIYGGFVRAGVDVVLPEDPDGHRMPRELADEVLRQLAPALAVLDALPGGEAADRPGPRGRAPVDDLPGDQPAGPVHLNIALRDPLQPEQDGEDAAREQVIEARMLRDAAADPGEDAARLGPTEAAVRWAPGEIPALSGAQRALLAEARSQPPAPRRTVVVAGDGAGTGAAQLAQALGLPLFAEPSSQARRGATAVGPYRALLETGPGREIERVLLVGRPTLSRPVAALLAREGVSTAAWRPRPVPWFAPGRRPEPQLRGLEEVLAFTGRAPQAWTRAWAEADARARGVADRILVEHLAAHPGAVPGQVTAAELWLACQHDGRLLVVGSSNPVRDLDLMAGPDPTAETGVDVLANRGLAGIDGVVATAMGAALATGRPTRVLLGDLTLLHDAGSLLQLAGERRPELQIVVLDDRGGGIFSTLEHGGLGESPAYRDPVERFFGTPPTAAIPALCAGYGLPCTEAVSPEQLRRALASPTPGISVVVVHAERAGLRSLDRRLIRGLRG